MLQQSFHFVGQVSINSPTLICMYYVPMYIYYTNNNYNHNAFNNTVCVVYMSVHTYICIYMCVCMCVCMCVANLHGVQELRYLRIVTYLYAYKYWQ